MEHRAKRKSPFRRFFAELESEDFLFIRRLEKSFDGSFSKLGTLSATA